jgi:hypothetical protein
MTIVTENQLFVEEIPELAAAKGQVRFTMKSRTPEDVALTGFCANVAASLLFERLKAQGTNIIIDYGTEAHIDVLARYEDDGINLLWTPKPSEPSQLDSTQERIRNKTFFIGKAEKQEEKSTTQTGSQQPGEAKAEKISPARSTDEALSEEEEDYLVKQLHRIP